MTVHRFPVRATALTFGLLAASLAYAADNADIGKTLTAMGAEKAGNAAGTIPAYDGGLTKPAAGFKPAGHYPDPFAADKPLFTITAADVDKYKDKLTVGQIALFKKYPSYKMMVYPTHRSASYPKGYYDETIANLGKAKLAANGNGVVNVTGGLPFPVPKDGNEAIWNALTRYRGENYALNFSQAAVTRGGDYTPVRFEQEISMNYGALGKKPSEREDNVMLYFVQVVTAPARLAGQVLLVHDTIDQAKTPRSAWTYNPGQRRVRLAPNVAYDNPGTAADGLRTNDDFGVFAGATDRYNWKLVGKKEIYIPYNSYKLSGNTVKMADILKPDHINQELARYELHRVWVVEATLKQGVTHIYPKRVIYIDEDSWLPTLADQYDARNELWRVAEWHSVNFADVPMHYGTVELHYDLQAGRYLALGLRNEEPKVYEALTRTAADYTPQNLRGTGVR